MSCIGDKWRDHRAHAGEAAARIAALRLQFGTAWIVRLTVAGKALRATVKLPGSNRARSYRIGTAGLLDDWRVDGKELALAVDQLADVFALCAFQDAPIDARWIVEPAVVPRAQALATPDQWAVYLACLHALDGATPAPPAPRARATKASAEQLLFAF